MISRASLRCIRTGSSIDEDKYNRDCVVDAAVEDDDGRGDDPVTEYGNDDLRFSSSSVS